MCKTKISVPSWHCIPVVLPVVRSPKAQISQTTDWRPVGSLGKATRGVMVDLEASFLSDGENESRQSSDGEEEQRQGHAITKDFEIFQAHGLMSERDLLRKRLVMHACMSVRLDLATLRP